MKQLLPFIISLSLNGAVVGQDTATVITDNPEPEISYPAVSASIYLDYGKAVTTLAGLEQKTEGAFSLLFLNQYKLIAEIGHATLSPEESYINGNYEATGNYLRFGGGYSHQLKPTNKLELGVRYGLSRFEDQGEIEIESPTGQPSFNQPFGRSNLEARWWEIVVTSDKLLRLNKENPPSRLNRLFSLGMNLRLRVLVTVDHRDDPDIYSIPGYGRSVNRTSPAVNLFLKINLF